MEKTIIYFKGEFTGLYFWGKGWKDMETRSKWIEFWEGYKGLFWHFFSKGDGIDRREYLTTTTGSIYLHPMYFTGSLVDCGVSCGEKYFTHEIEELEKACKECADYCGGSFRLLQSEEIEVDFGELKEKERKGNKID